MTPDPHIDALMLLLDDPDPVVKESVRRRLLQIGPAVAARLRGVIADPPDEVSRQEAVGALNALGVERFRAAFTDILLDAEGRNDIDLEQGALAVAFLGWPDLDPEVTTQQFDTMASMIEDRLTRCDNGYMVAREMNRYLIDQLGFRGCRQEQGEYYDPDNSYVNRILERRLANPVGLSIIYLLIARRLGIPLFGVGFPSHFLLKYRSLGEEFFIDPFNGGQILSAVDCRRFLQDLDIEYRPSYLESVNSRRIVARIMRNLAEIRRAEQPPVADELEAAIDRLLDEEAWGGRATEQPRPSL